jgi:Fe2+ or Zn2+ uptake regulation protein
MTPTRRQIENLVMRIQNAFLDAPALALTLPAAEERFSVAPATLAGVLDALVDAGVLTTREGTYRRRFPAGTERRAA